MLFPARFLLWGRLFWAARLLSNAELSVECAAFRLGYSSAPALGRALRREIGLSTGDLRARGPAHSKFCFSLGSAHRPRARFQSGAHDGHQDQTGAVGFSPPDNRHEPPHADARVRIKLFGCANRCESAASVSADLQRAKRACAPVARHRPQGLPEPACGSPSGDPSPHARAVPSPPSGWRGDHHNRGAALAWSKLRLKAPPGSVRGACKDLGKGGIRRL